MKTKSYILIAVFFLSLGVNAQIDRSKQPQPGPAPVISLKKPKEFKLKNGLKVMVVENHKLPRVSFTLAIDRDPVFEGNKAGVTSILGSMLGNGTINISKDDFNEEIDFLGASLGFGFAGGSASSITKYSSRMLELLADAAMNPLLIEEEFQKEKEKLIEGIKSNAKSVDAIAGRVGGALAYGKQHPYGEFITEETAEAVTLDDVKEYYKQYFNPNTTYLVIIGDVNTKSIMKLVKKYFKRWDKANVLYPLDVKANKNPKSLEINFIDMPNAVQSNISLSSNVSLKMNDSDYHSVLIANKILGGGFNSYLNMNLREEHGYTYGARSSVGTDKFISRFSAGTAVRNAVTDSAVVETIKEIKRIMANPVDAEALSNAKAKYVGDFVLALERPSTIAQYAINTKVNKLPEDFYTTYLQKINAVTIEDVQRVANKYFSAENARIIIVGKGSEVIENLEKTGIPINYFDTFANPVEKPEFSKPIPAGVTAATVIESYITAIGGLELVNAVTSMVVSMDVNIEGMPFKPTAVIKMMSPNMSSMEMSIEGMGTVVKEKYNGSEGYTEQQGMKTPMSENELAEKAEEKGLFPETYLNTSTLTLISLTAIDGVDVYKVMLKEDSFRYYDAASGLLIRTEKTEEAQGQKVTSVDDLSDYREVNGVLLPFVRKTTVGPQVIGLSTTNIIVNEGVSAEDFN
jgi:predicted Zn-dependent peptidase